MYSAGGGSTYTFGDNKIKMLETLLDLVRKVESGEVDILEMSISPETETRDFQTFDSRMNQRMAVSNEIRIEMRLAVSAARNPIEYADRERRDRDRVDALRAVLDANTTGAIVSREQVALTVGMTREEMSRARDEIERESATITSGMMSGKEFFGTMGAPPFINPWTKENWNPVAQAKYIRDYGIEKARQWMFPPEDDESWAALAMLDPPPTQEGVVFPRPKIPPKTAPKEPINPLNYGARKVDLD